MTYQALYRKYRSQTFADLVGQEAASRALQGAVTSDRVAHAYLFSGTRGTGKTSTARLLAKALNCTNRLEGSAEPCAKCANCLAIGEGSALDLIEIDAASNRGIDEIRDLREKVSLAPIQALRKVYIIDEAHMLTTEAFNALLKTLEEPPPHVVFVLCTTEATKIPQTVVGRCQQFVFRRISVEQIADRLAYITEQEGIQAESTALELIAELAQGSLRDAVGQLDQLAPLDRGKITVSAVRELLGLAEPSRLDELLEAILGAQAGEALKIVDAIYAAGGELRQLVRGLMERARDRLVVAVEGGDEQLRLQMGKILQGLLALDGEVRRHAEPRFLVEATVVRLAADCTSSPILPAGEREAPSALPSPPAKEVENTPSITLSVGDGWQEHWQNILHELPLKPRACFREARAELSEEGKLILFFPYEFHHRMAQEHLAEVDPRVRRWLGDSATLELRLDEATTEKVSQGFSAADDPVIKAAVRKLEGRVRESPR